MLALSGQSILLSGGRGAAFAATTLFLSLIYFRVGKLLLSLKETETETERKIPSTEKETIFEQKKKFNLKFAAKR